MTKPGLFGAQGDDAGAYLKRWVDHNRLFADDVRIEGVTSLPGENGLSVVISQPFRAGRDATIDEITGHLTGKGFRQIGDRWIHPFHGLAVWDIQTPGNAIMADDGLHVIDLQIGDAFLVVRRTDGRQPRPRPRGRGHWP